MTIISKRKHNFFQGWYSKIQFENKTFAFIFGYALSENKHAFIQVNDGYQNQSYYFEFSIDDLYIDSQKFFIKIGENYLSDKKMYLDLVQSDLHFNVDVTFTNFTPLITNSLFKTIMGPVNLIPNLECVHGVNSVHHDVEGTINISSNSLTKQFDFTGFGYLETDSGFSMPKWWIWLQTLDEETSFMFSIAQIPYLNMKFLGFLGFFSDASGQDIFASYNNSKIIEYEYTDKFFYVEIINKKRKYDVLVSYDSFNPLIAPINGTMTRTIKESLNSSLKLVITDLETSQKTTHKYFNLSCEFVNPPEFF